MKIAIVSPGRDTSELQKLLKFAGHTIEVWPAVSKPTDIEIVVCWKHEIGVLQQFSNVRLLACLGAGVDHLLSDPDLPNRAIITRFTDRSLSLGISQYVCTAILNFKLNWSHYSRSQKRGVWKPIEPKEVIKIGILGLGRLGQETAKGLLGLGFEVAGFSGSQKAIDNVDCFHGDMKPFLQEVNVIVCLLPLTKHTRSLMNDTFFDMCQRGTYVINVARGEILEEGALLRGIKSGKVSGACLDVFPVEPVPPNHEFWSHPQIMVTPHTASVSNQSLFAEQLLKNLKKLKAGNPLLDTVDKEKGY